jgi:hypothetical protein
MRTAAHQWSFPTMNPLEEALRSLKEGGVEERGAIFTRREVVDFILDLVGYTQDAPLHQQRLLEPSFGGGDFLLAAIERLIAAYAQQTASLSAAVEDLGDAIRGIELHRSTFDQTRARVVALLQRAGITARQSVALAGIWLADDDFLLREFDDTFTHIVGNPPYVRQELIPDVIWAAYRDRFSTIYDRADIYVPFIERSLQLLRPAGRLSFICADRWMKNRYGRPLRELVSSGFHLASYVDMVDTPAFHSDVMAYPAITVIVREPAGPSRVTHRPVVDRAVLAQVSAAMRGETPHPQVSEVPHVATGGGPWVLGEFDRFSVVQSLEEQFPTLEDAGCKVGIGVATGADKAFIGPYEELDVEPERKLPLAMTSDIASGRVEWRGLGIVNPFEPDGTLADFKRYPRFGRYMKAREDVICNRHVARKNPNGWYRTIDRIYPELTQKPKLLIPDIKGRAHIVFEEGRLYPHHNLYFVTSESWDLRALQAVLRSAVGQVFISAYSTKMRGGYWRFQAQYLRRIRIPRWEAVPRLLRTHLVEVAESPCDDDVNAAVFALYGLSPDERAILTQV